MRWRAILLALVLAVAFKSPVQAQGTPPATAAALIFGALGGAVTSAGIGFVEGGKAGGWAGAAVGAVAGAVSSFLSSYIKEKYLDPNFLGYNVAAPGLVFFAGAIVTRLLGGNIFTAEVWGGLVPGVIQEYFSNESSGWQSVAVNGILSFLGSMVTTLATTTAAGSTLPFWLGAGAVGILASIVDQYLHGNPEISKHFSALPPPPGAGGKLSLLFPQILSGMVVPPAPNAAPVPAQPSPATPVTVSSDGLCHYSDGSFQVPGTDYTPYMAPGYTPSDAPCAPMLCYTSDNFTVDPSDLSHIVKGQCVKGTTPVYLTSAPSNTAPRHDVAPRFNLILRPNLIHPDHPAIPLPPPIPGEVVLKHHDQHPASVEHTSRSHTGSVRSTTPRERRHRTRRLPRFTRRIIPPTAIAAWSDDPAASMSAAEAGSHRGVGGGRRRSDIRLKEDIIAVGRLDNGIGLYRFRYRGSDRTVYVGVMAQEVRTVLPEAVTRGRDGYLRVDYDILGLPFTTWEEWLERGGARPAH